MLKFKMLLKNNLRKSKTAHQEQNKILSKRVRTYNFNTNDGIIQVSSFLAQ